jgi:hypothetical protein
MSNISASASVNCLAESLVAHTTTAQESPLVQHRRGERGADARLQQFVRHVLLALVVVENDWRPLQHRASGRTFTRRHVVLDVSV